MVPGTLRSIPPSLSSQVAESGQLPLQTPSSHFFCPGIEQDSLLEQLTIHCPLLHNFVPIAQTTSSLGIGAFPVKDQNTETIPNKRTTEIITRNTLFLIIITTTRNHIYISFSTNQLNPSGPK